MGQYCQGLTVQGGKAYGALGMNQDSIFMGLQWGRGVTITYGVPMTDAVDAIPFFGYLDLLSRQDNFTSDWEMLNNLPQGQ